MERKDRDCFNVVFCRVLVIIPASQSEGPGFVSRHGL